LIFGFNDEQQEFAMSATMPNLKLEYLSIDALQPDPKNPRKHSNEQTKALARAMGEFGFTNPVLADKTGVVIAGHCRLLASHRNSGCGRKVL
jgi:hypothetical protein